MDGIRFGFKVGFSSGMLNSAEEMSSAFSNLSVVDKYFKKELDRGSNTGTFSDYLINGLYSNRFGLVPYPVWGEGRRIIDLSFARGNSVDDFLTQGLQFNIRLLTMLLR